MESPIVEFWMPANAYNDNPYATYMETPPEQIIAIHEPWHGHYRYALENNLLPEELRGIDEDYEKAADALESRSKASNPLVLPKHMSEWMLDSKVNAVVTLHPDTFLDLTTNGPQHKLSIMREAQSLDQYNQYAEKENTQIPPFLKINIIDSYDRSLGKVVTHEGRHRAAALLANGENSMPVALVLAEGFVPSRQRTVLDMPLRWLSEYTDQMFIASSIIGEILHSNVQEQYQKKGPPDIPMTVQEWAHLTQGSLK
jgi:hypothetical protein